MGAPQSGKDQSTKLLSLTQGEKAQSRGRKENTASLDSLRAVGYWVRAASHRLTQIGNRETIALGSKVWRRCELVTLNSSPLALWVFTVPVQ